MMKIEPDSFDVLVVGTGLIQSIVAASVAVSGKTVLQVDPNEYYGGSWATLPCDEIITWARGRGRDARTFGSIDESLDRKRILFDLSPKLAYGDGPLISLLLASGAHNYTEFTLVKSVVWSHERGTFVPVAASRAEIFRDQTLTLKQKNVLMKAVRDITGTGYDPEETLVSLLRTTVGDEDLKDRLLHGVLLQHNSNPDLRVSDASRLLTMYGRSSGKYGKNSSPFLLPIYGGGEMPQAFCRTAAVNGAVQCLRCGLDKVERRDSGEFDVTLTNGQKVHAGAVMGSPDLVPSLASSSVQVAHTMHCCFALAKGKVFPEERHCVASFPRASSLGHTIWLLQRDSSSGCCPEGYSCLQLWCVADDCPSSTPEAELKGILTKHLDCSSVLFDDGDHSSHQSPTEGGTAKLEFACFVSFDTTNQGDAPSLHDNVALCADGSHDVSYLSIKDEAERCFQVVCKGEVLFPYGESPPAEEGALEKEMETILEGSKQESSHTAR